MLALWQADRQARRLTGSKAGMKASTRVGRQASRHEGWQPGAPSGGRQQAWSEAFRQE